MSNQTLYKICWLFKISLEIHEDLRDLIKIKKMSAEKHAKISSQCLLANIPEYLNPGPKNLE